MRSRLQIQNADKSLMVYVSTTLPQSIRSNIEASFTACISNITHLQDMDSQLSSVQKLPFVAIHCSWYNRNATKVSGLAS